MSPQTVTLDLQNDMPRHSGLLRRGSRWFTNFKVPLPLRAALGKEHIREALGTSDYWEACRKVAYERARWTAIFEHECKKQAALLPRTTPKKKSLLTVLSKQEAFELASRYLATHEREFRGWMDKEGNHLAPYKKAEILSTLDMDTRDLATGEEFQGKPLDGTEELKSFLESESIECAVSSPAFQTLRPLIREAHVEHLKRSQDMLKGVPMQERSNLFKGVHSHSPAIVEIIDRPTINDLLALRQSTVQDLELSEKSADASVLPARLLRECFGGDKPLVSITLEDMRNLFALLRRAPKNAAQRYKGKTLLQAVEAADNANDTCRLKSSTLRNNFIQITALFNLAVDYKMIPENPCKNKTLRRCFGGRKDTTPREQFTIVELNRLFRAPLYSGCIDDERAYKKPGENHPKRGRFWVPLLALFHGTRCNEACQIHTADVKTRDGIVFISIREELEDGGVSDKRLKTKQSRREVPLHPELKELGFIEFVEERRRDMSSPRLFPELTLGHKMYASDAFSKWFTRFVEGTLGEGCKARMHSFRHQFRDATRVARLPAETVARLAGWEDGEGPVSRQMNHYGRGPEYFRLLAEDIAKVQYPGLDLSHLYLANLSKKENQPRRLRED